MGQNANHAQLYQNSAKQPLIHLSMTITQYYNKRLKLLKSKHHLHTFGYKIINTAFYKVLITFIISYTTAQYLFKPYLQPTAYHSTKTEVWNIQCIKKTIKNDGF